MTAPFGPQLIGETEKSLGAVLRRHLADIDLTEPQWVTLRVADQLSGERLPTGLATEVADRARFEDAAELVAGLVERGLLREDRLTDQGARLLHRTQAALATDTRSIWDGLDADDVGAAERVLGEVVTRARRVLERA